MSDARWHRHFLGMALYHARMSKDPLAKVGAVIVGPDREVLSAGFNGLPRGIKDTNTRLHDRDTKLKLIVHAEMNAILVGARVGVRLMGSTLYLACKDPEGRIYGGSPCTRCAVEIIQAGITHVVAYPAKTPSNWAEDLALARTLLEEAEVSFIEVFPAEEQVSA